MAGDERIKQYMVDFQVPFSMSPEFTSRIPEQRKRVNDLFVNGKLLSYTLSANKDRLWAIFLVTTESELLHLIDSFPLTIYMDYQYHELLFHQSLRLLPSLSMN